MQNCDYGKERNTQTKCYSILRKSPELSVPRMWYLLYLACAVPQRLNMKHGSVSFPPYFQCITQMHFDSNLSNNKVQWKREIIVFFQNMMFSLIGKG